MRQVVKSRFAWADVARAESRLVARDSAASLSASLFAWLLVVRVLLQFAQQTTLLQLHVEALQGAVD